MKVYLLQEFCQDGPESNFVYGVYSTMEKAIEARKKSNCELAGENWDIDEIEMDRPAKDLGE